MKHWKSTMFLQRLRLCRANYYAYITNNIFQFFSFKLSVSKQDWQGQKRKEKTFEVKNLFELLAAALAISWKVLKLCLARGRSYK